LISDDGRRAVIRAPPTGPNLSTPFLDVVTPRRLITTALLLLALVLSVVGLQAVKDTRAASCSYGVILKFYPCPGDTDLRQGTIGVDMAPGWQASLTVDNTPIPQDEIGRASCRERV